MPRVQLDPPLAPPPPDAVPAHLSIASQIILAGDVKLKALCEVIASTAQLSQADRLNVLSAAAKFYNLTIKLDV
jgi:hypothetical protein